MSDLIVSRVQPVELGLKPPAESIPVVLASSDDISINVKQTQPETEVALSLLGIPRSETTLGVFSDVTTYGIDKEIWASFPEVYSPEKGGVRFLENRSAGKIEAPPGKFALLNTKRAFPYLPGRVSSSTFGLRAVFQDKISATDAELVTINSYYNTLSTPPIRKWGQYGDKNGYYFEVRGVGLGDNFLNVRRTDGIPTTFLIEKYTSVFIPEANRFQYVAPASGPITITQVPSGIVADDLYYSHAVLNDMSLEVPQNTPGAVRVYDGHTGLFKYVNKNNATVYEYRVPRSWFGFDQLNGQTGNPMKYSDVVYIDNIKRLPGETIVGKSDDSVRQINFSKVTMYKTEYSWYGAIGCIFLTYVPVLDDTARWVKMHYLRGSNQLSFPTLGNPYLPMCFYVQNPAQNTFTESVEKYGASYFIDGADKGSVRVFSIINDSGTTVNTGVTGLRVGTSVSDSGIFSNFANPFIRSPHTTRVFSNFKTYLIGAYLLGSVTVVNAGQTVTKEISPGSIIITDIKITDGESYIFLNQQIFDEFGSTGVSSITYNNLRAECPRGQFCLGIKMKKTIGPSNVVSKASVFPVRLNTGNGNPSKATFFRLIKNGRLPEKNNSVANTRSMAVKSNIVIPGDIRTVRIEFWKNVVTSGDFTVPGTGTTVYIKDIPGLLSLVSSSSNFNTYDFTRYEPGTDTVLVPSPAYNTPLSVTSNSRGFDMGIQETGFDLQFRDIAAPTSTNNTYTQSPDIYSAINYDTAEARLPLVNTGQVVASLITGPGSSDDFDLTPYFGFNKEFLAGSGLSLEVLFDDELIVIGNTFDVDSSMSISPTVTNLTWEEQ